ncbi:Hypothetical protein FKW44_022486 [Caligus rogercresseyi]|uniref:Uncharacterized protein n=1 Tax=Caligus rogercresseyi TaxID=217165 RepID=A0A7T8GNH2_CALRO|nr:Hypothetical protein FKW44_022486 [Caligus rogercresseyi]
MNARDRASGDEYRRLRNRVSSLVKRDQVNIAKIHTAKNKPKTLWGLANKYLASPRPLSPPH